jgi:hypothetical protein
MRRSRLEVKHTIVVSVFSSMSHRASRDMKKNEHIKHLVSESVNKVKKGARRSCSRSKLPQIAVAAWPFAEPCVRAVLLYRVSDLRLCTCVLVAAGAGKRVFVWHLCWGF